MTYEETYGAVHGWLRHKVGRAKPPCERCGAKTKDDYTVIPTLSELIEACGSELRFLRRVENSTDWIAGTYDVPSEVGFPDSNYESGENPEEAVAKLWLSLNKK